MRIAGRQKGSKVKPYTHILVQPSAPKSRYVFAYYSSEAKANAALKKYEPLIGNPLKVIKQSGKSGNTDMHEKNIEEKGLGLWHNIHMKRKSGKKMRKKGETGAPSPEAMARAKSASEMTTTAMAGIPQDTKDMGPRFSTTSVLDRRKKKRPALLKRFSRFIEPND
jgi:hypothetical protein